MALVLLKYQLTVNFMETSGETVTRTYEADVAEFATFADFITEINTPVTGFLPQLIALSDSVVSSYIPAPVYVEDALTLPAAAENQNQALISAKIVGDPTASATLSIPAPKDALFTSATGAGYNVVLTSYAPLAAWLSNFADAAPWTLSDGEHIVLATLKGKRRHVKSNNT